MNVNQKALGNNNYQNTQIFNRPLDPIDICADKIGPILRTISKVDFFQPRSALTPPDITLKNVKNAIDHANATEIEKTYALWDEITQAISSDAIGEIADDYNKAAYILQQKYLAQYQNNFPDFKINCLTIYCQNASADLDDAYLLVHLIHYMYLSCQVGVKP